MSKRLLGVAVLLLLASSAAAGSPAESIAQSIKDVEKIRGLTFLGPVKVVSIERDKLPVYLRAQFEKSLPYSFDDYMLLLESLRLVEPGTKNPEQSLIDLMQQQVLAFYDPLTHVYYAIDKLPSGLPAVPTGMALEDSVAVHELTHALQDQRFGIGKEDVATRHDTDANLALHSLIEGEASLVMMAKMLEPMGATIDTIAKDDTMIDALAKASVAMTTDGTTPRYFVESLVVPYTAGMKFVIAGYRRGGWAAVTRVYKNPPHSMREILHPDEYFSGKRTTNPFSLTPPVPVSHVLSVEHLGEWHWQFLVGPDASEGWTGDRVTVAQDAFCDPTVLVETTWESPERAAAFRTAYTRFLKKEKVDAEVRTRGNEVDVAYGADPALVERFITR
ncbi:MAG TPA: hypothetical protein VH087_03660 [Thermoanaerobaculia bacterium]|jgi:hypothetical protein|nr:hypothetical protein [Thermoanaerobaculia bacterium]